MKRTKPVVSDTWIACSIMWGTYRANEFTPETIVGTPFVRFQLRNTQISYVAKKIVKIQGKGFGKIVELHNKRRDRSGHMRADAVIQIL